MRRAGLLLMPRLVTAVTLLFSLGLGLFWAVLGKVTLSLADVTDATLWAISSGMTATATPLADLYGQVSVEWSDPAQNQQAFWHWKAPRD